MTFGVVKTNPKKPMARRTGLSKKPVRVKKAWACNHKSIKHYAKGLCKPCYQELMKEKSRILKDIELPRKRTRSRLTVDNKPVFEE